MNLPEPETPDEPALHRASREWTQAVESWKFIVLTALFDAVCVVGVALVVRGSQSSTLRVVVLAAVIGAIGGTVLSLASVGLVQFLRAPYLQRDDAYAQRDQARSEVARLTAPRAFPDVAIDLPTLAQGPAEYGTHIEVPIIATNRGDERVSLEFHLVIRDPAVPVPSRVKCFREATPSNTGLHPPLSIAPKDTADSILHFPLIMEQVVRLRAQAVRPLAGLPESYVPLDDAYVEIHDRVTDTYRKHFFGLDTVPPAL